MNKSLIQRLVDALTVANNFLKLAENNLGVEPSGDYDAPLIAEARAAIAAPVGQEEWVKRGIHLAGLFAKAMQLLHTGLNVGESTKALDELEKHLRSHPAFVVPEGFALVPIEPTPGKLMSMAIRHDHALGMPGYYDQLDGVFGNGVSHQKRLESIIRQMRQLHEEVVGLGFYSAEEETDYAAMIAASGEGK